MIDLLILDDHKLFAEGLGNLLRSDESIHVTAIFNNGKSLLSYLKDNSTDILLIDLNMPDMDGFAVIEHLKASGSQLKCIILSTYADDKLINEAVKLGVDAYLLKDAEPDELIYTIKEVYEDRYQFSTDHILKQTQPSTEFTDDFLKKHQLSKREVEIIQLLKTGLTNQEIADSLFLSILTIQTHRKNIIHKLKLNNTTELINFAHQNGL